MVFYAQEEAQRFGEGFVSTEHLLLGLVRESNSVAARVLERLGITLEQVRTEVEAQLPRGDKKNTTDMTLTPRAKRVIDLAFDEARNLNNNYIGTEHLLLGLIRESDGLAGRALAEVGVTLEDARTVVVELQGECSTEAASQPAGEGLLKRLAVRLRGSSPAPDPAETERAAIRAKLVFYAGNGPLTDQFEPFLRSLGLVPMTWAQAKELSGVPLPTAMALVATARAVGGAIVFVLSPSMKGPDLEDLLFTAGISNGLDYAKTLLVRMAADEPLGESLEMQVLRVDNSKESRQVLVEALRAAGCPADDSGEEWLTAGDFVPSA